MNQPTSEQFPDLLLADSMLNLSAINVIDEARIKVLTTFPSKSPYLNSHTGACRRYTEMTSLSLM